MAALDAEPADALLVDDSAVPRTIREAQLDWMARARVMQPDLVVLLLSEAAVSDARVHELGVDDAIVTTDLDTLAKRVQACHAARGGRAAADRAARRDVLVVDDDADARVAMKEALRRAGYHVRAAEGGAEALAMLRERESPVLLVDQMMPEMSGAEFVAAARRLDPRVVAVIITGHPSKEVAAEAIRSGAVGFVTKPVAPRELAQAVDAAWREWAVGRRARRGGAMRVLHVGGEADGLDGVLTGAWTASFAPTVSEALRFIATERCEVVLFEPNGDDVAEFVRLHAADRSLPIVVLTADGDEEFGEQLLQCGAQECLSRAELTPQLLSSRLWYAMDRQRLLTRLGRMLHDLDASDASRLQILDRAADAALVVDANGLILKATPEAARLFGQDTQQLEGTPFADVAQQEGEMAVVLPDGGTRFVEIRTSAATWRGQPATLVMIRDVTERRHRELQVNKLAEQLAEANRELERLATIDALTEVLNRRGVEDAVLRELETARRTGGNMAACLVGCDDFKRVNEVYGHAAGDVMLRRIAERLGGALRLTDTIGRIGGDEFVLLLPQTRMAEAVMVAERARIAVSQGPVMLDESAVPVGVSIGVASVPWDVASLDEVLVLTRMALRDSKQSGKNQVSSSSGSLALSPALQELVNGLVSGAGLRAVAQPIVRVSDEHVVGYELLSRGREGLFEAPDQFLRVARDQGMLTTVDLHCLKICLACALELPDELDLHLNLFPTTLLDLPIDELVRLFQERRSGRLCLELSEEQFVGDPKELRDRIAALRSTGVRLAIDDVGKGRGTLDSVMLLEPEMVKIDKDLVRGACSDIRKERLLRRLVTLCGALSCEIVGEGVETRGDLELLRELEVPFAQGFLWSEPRDPSEWLEDAPKEDG